MEMSTQNDERSFEMGQLHLDDDDDDLQPKMRREFTDHTDQWEDGVLGVTLYGEIVEDIHPDFQ